jgi:hypothetical protein
MWLRREIRIFGHLHPSPLPQGEEDKTNSLLKVKEDKSHSELLTDH